MGIVQTSLKASAEAVKASIRMGAQVGRTVGRGVVFAWSTLTSLAAKALSSYGKAMQVAYHAIR